MDQLTPIYRIEFFLDAIVNNSSNDLEPIYRVEFFLARIAGRDVEIPQPMSRMEMFLAKLCGETVTLPTPQSRTEQYLAAICGEDVEIPPFPVYRIEYWLAAWAEGGSEIVTVTGIAPLALLDAVAHPIHSLTQYGLCVQDGTPTPDAPVDILCNNGALCMVDDELPSGYKRLSGITFDGEVYYVTNYHIRGTDTLRFSFKATETGRNVIGCYNGTDATDNLSFYFSTGSAGVYLRYNGGLYRPVAWTNTSYNCVISPTGVTGLSTDASWTEVDFTSAAALFIGWLDNATSPKFRGDMYGSIVVDSRANFIPVERQSDGAIGYWDGQTFLENQGTGTPVSLGYDGSHYQLSVVGTPEVLTVSGQNLVDLTAVTDGYYYDQNGVYTAAEDARLSDFIPVKAGQKYTAYVANLGSRFVFNVRVNLFSTDRVWLSQSVTPVTKPSVIVITPTEDGYLRLSANYKGTSSTSSWADWSTLQIVRGEYTVSTMPPYEPYVTPQTVSVPMLLGVGDYKDEQEILSGVVTRKVGVLVLDGTEAWEQYTTGSVTRFSTKSPTGFDIPKDSNMRAYCNILVDGGYQTSGTTMQNGTFSYTSAQSIYLRMAPNNGITTVEGWQQWLAAQYAAGTPVILVYPLATETTEQTTPHALHTSAGTNVVDVAAAVEGVTLKVEYAKEAS